jgi:hypothetical protein
MICWMSLRDYAKTMKTYMDARKELFTEFELPPHGYPLRLLDIPIRDEVEGSGEGVSSSAAATTTTASNPIYRYKFRIVYRCASNVTRESLENDRERLTEHLRRFRAWFYEKEDLESLSDKVSVEGFELALIRQIPFIILPYSENVYLIEIPALGQESEE